MLYAKINREREDKMKELASKYVDRAALRREGGESTESSETQEPAAGYRAMAPTAQGAQVFRFYLIVVKITFSRITE